MFHFTVETKKPSPVDEAIYDFIALGGGPAGLNGALYAKRKGLRTAVLAYDLGGQLKNTSSVDNYLGFDNIDAGQLIDRFVSHLRSLDVPLITSVRVAAIEKQADLFHLRLDSGRTIKTKTLLAALGGSPRKLDVPGEERLGGKGVSYCATCDAPFFKDKHVVVAGGGNSAVESAMDLAKWASHVTIIHRSKFRADQTLLDKLDKIANIDVRLETQILEILGPDHVDAVKIKDKRTETVSTFPADGIFIEIGTIPNTALFVELAHL
ncbi:MAG: FAD-dependent oxidoreductase, partial [Bacillota bacterium]|nr:FAD-dependent oxidoreductase [Bacillota bacterium]